MSKGLWLLVCAMLGLSGTALFGAVLHLSNTAHPECASGNSAISVPVCTQDSGPVTINQNDESTIYSIGELSPANWHTIYSIGALAPANWHTIYSIGALIPANWHRVYSTRALPPPRLYDGDEAASNYPLASVAVHFNGTGIVWTGETGRNFGIVNYLIDGSPTWMVDGSDHPISYNTFNGYSTAGANRPNVTISGLASGSHVLQLQISGTTTGSGIYTTADSFTITGSALPVSSGSMGYCSAGNSVGCTSSNMTYTGLWSCGRNNGNISPTGIHCWDPNGASGDSVSWTFTGSLIEIFGRPDTGNGIYNVFIDGSQVGTVDGWCHCSSDDDGITAVMLYAQKLSSGGQHTIKIVNTGTHNINGGIEHSGLANLIQLDQFLAFP